MVQGICAIVKIVEIEGLTTYEGEKKMECLRFTKHH